eukprot:1087623-Prorocentrum_minimum.AAC.2
MESHVSCFAGGRGGAQRLAAQLSRTASGTKVDESGQKWTKLVESGRKWDWEVYKRIGQGRLCTRSRMRKGFDADIWCP